MSSSACGDRWFGLRCVAGLLGSSWGGLILFLGYGLSQLAYRGGQGFGIAISPIY
ncbi:MAG: hypothetical protein WBB01_06930 [Phormidesmis sp.]